MPNSIGTPIKFGIGRLRKKNIGILDDIDNVVAAYALRKLRKDYSGPIVEVRNSSGSLSNIYATSNGELDITSYNNHVAGGHGYISTWYDQGGSGRDARQDTLPHQPFLQMVDGKPSVRFYGSQRLGIPATSMSTVAIAIAFRFLGTSGGGWATLFGKISANINAPFMLRRRLDTAQVEIVDGARTQAAIPNGTTHVISAAHDGALGSVWTNGTSKMSAAGGWGSDTGSVWLGARNDLSAGLDGVIFEFVWTTSISTEDHNAIGGNMATRYGLSWTNVT